MCDWRRQRFPGGGWLPPPERNLLSPAVFFSPDGEPECWAPPTDLIDAESWDGIVSLAMRVALESSGYAGSVINRLNNLHDGWVFSWPEPGAAPFVEYPSLIAGEEFDALVFNALQGYYREAIGCLRVALETMAMAAGFAVSNNSPAFQLRQDGQLEAKFGRARILLRDSPVGRPIDHAVAPRSVFGDADNAWLNARYKHLCKYAHRRAGHDNGVRFWESSGPLFVPRALDTVEREFRETLALCYLLQRPGWPAYVSGPGQPALLQGPTDGWSDYTTMLQMWLQ